MRQRLGQQLTTVLGSGRLMVDDAGFLTCGNSSVGRASTRARWARWAQLPGRRVDPIGHRQVSRPIDCRLFRGRRVGDQAANALLICPSESGIDPGADGADMLDEPGGRGLPDAVVAISAAGRAS